MSPTICSSTSSMVTRPATPPYSLTTMAMWLRETRNSRSSTFRRFDSGMKTAGRSQSRRSKSSSVMDAQQILGEQDAQHVVAVAVDDREAGVGSLDDDGDDLGERVVDVDDVHLRPRDHHVGNAGVGGGQGAFDDGQRIGVHQVALVGRVQEINQLFPVFRLSVSGTRKTIKQGRFTTGGFHKKVDEKWAMGNEKVCLAGGAEVSTSMAHCSCHRRRVRQGARRFWRAHRAFSARLRRGHQTPGQP